MFTGSKRLRVRVYCLSNRPESTIVGAKHDEGVSEANRNHTCCEIKKNRSFNAARLTENVSECYVDSSYTTVPDDRLYRSRFQVVYIDKSSGSGTIVGKCY